MSPPEDGGKKKKIACVGMEESYATTPLPTKTPFGTLWTCQSPTENLIPSLQESKEKLTRIEEGWAFWKGTETGGARHRRNEAKAKVESPGFRSAGRGKWFGLWVWVCGCWCWWPRRQSRWGLFWGGVRYQGGGPKGIRYG